MDEIEMRQLKQRQLKQRLALSLDEKIKYSIDRIMEWYAYWGGLVYVAFSGGKDSTVLAHLVRSVYPDVPLVFCNTGLEFPENIKFINTFKNKNLIILKPKKTYQEVIDLYGYPIVSKRQAQYIHEVRVARSNTATKHLRLTGWTSKGTYSQMDKISKKWLYLVDSPIKVSDRCCNVMKKSPAKTYSKKTGRMAYTGIMVGEGKRRELTYLQNGCNSYDLKTPNSKPLAIWTAKNIWEYIKRFNVAYSKIYDKGYDRTGCIYCGFGVHLEKGLNRFQRLKQTHPARWKYCMDKLGLREVMKVYGVPIEENQMCLRKIL